MYSAVRGYRSWLCGHTRVDTRVYSGISGIFSPRAARLQQVGLCVVDHSSASMCCLMPYFLCKLQGKVHTQGCPGTRPGCLIVLGWIPGFLQSTFSPGGSFATSGVVGGRPQQCIDVLLDATFVCKLHGCVLWVYTPGGTWPPNLVV